MVHGVNVGNGSTFFVMTEEGLRSGRGRVRVMTVTATGYGTRSLFPFISKYNTSSATAYMHVCGFTVIEMR